MQPTNEAYFTTDNIDADAFRALKIFPPHMAYRYANMSKAQYRESILYLSAYYARPPPGMSKEDHGALAVAGYEEQTRRNERKYRRELRNLMQGKITGRFMSELSKLGEKHGN